MISMMILAQTTPVTGWQAGGLDMIITTCLIGYLIVRELIGTVEDERGVSMPAALTRFADAGVVPLLYGFAFVVATRIFGW